MRSSIRIHAPLCAAAILLCSIVEAQWPARWNTSGSAEDQGQAVAVDRFGNVYVAGKTKNWNTHFDFQVLKYSAAGVLVWERHWDGPGHHDDVPTSIAVDYDLNVYIAGYSRSTGFGSRGYDMAVIKFHANGNAAWPPDGGGDSGGNGDEPGWEFYQGAFMTTSTEDEGLPPAGVSMAVKQSFDPGERIIAITGTRAGTGGIGWRTWVLEPTSTAIQRKQGWPVNEPTPTERGRAFGIAINPTDNTVYVCGDEHYTTGGEFFTTVRFKAAGKLASGGPIQYHHKYNPNGTKPNGARAIVLDPAGNAYITGFITEQPLSDPRIATIRLNESLTGVTTALPAWADDDYGTGQFNVGTSIDLTHEVENSVVKRYVYVTGRAGADIATMRLLSDDGARQWTASPLDGAVRYNASLTSTDFDITWPKVYGAGLGNAYVVGTTNSVGTDPNYVGLAYRKNATERWTAKTYDGPTNFDTDEAFWGVMVGAGAIVPTGVSPGSGTSQDVLTEKWTQIVTTYSPSNYSIVRGSLVSGSAGVEGLESDDNVYMKLNYGENWNRGPQVQVEFTKEIPSGITPTEVTFTVITSTPNWQGIDQKFEVYDYTSGSWELVDSRDTTSSTEMKITCVMKSDPHRYMDPNTRTMKVRLSWEEPTFAVPRWQAWVEQLTWDVIGS